MAKSRSSKKGQIAKHGTAAPYVGRSRVRSALDQLVQQFSQSLAFIRELVQNSIDAGSNRVDINVEFNQQQQMCTIAVSDGGEGMTRQVIDERLTQLFSSSKENDLTKVGKFGVGFVSVFAMEPQAVVVDTGCRGESWRIIFHPDRSFDRVALPDQLDGTTVTLFLDKPRAQLSKLIEECHSTAHYWCRHCLVDIFLNGQLVNKPFQLEQEVAFSWAFESTGTRAVIAAKTGKGQSDFCGFYNSGLTLLEQKKSAIEGLWFKLDSRYLEHTLTRDAVQQNDDYHKALAHIRKALETDYWPNFGLHLQELQKDPVQNSDALNLCYQTLTLAWENWPHLSAQMSVLPCFPCLQADSQSLRWQSRQQLLETKLQIVTCTTRTRLVERLLTHQKAVVVQTNANNAFGPLCKLLLDSPKEAKEIFCLCEEVPADNPQSVAFGALVARLNGVLQKAGVSGLHLVTWDDDWDKQTQFLTTHPKTGVPATRFIPFEQCKSIVCNQDNPLTGHLLTLASKDELLATQWLAQRLCLAYSTDATQRQSLLNQILDESQAWK